MMSKIVTVDGVRVDVSCTSSTPLWEILERAAHKLKIEEAERKRHAENKENTTMLSR